METPQWVKDARRKRDEEIDRWLANYDAQFYGRKRGFWNWLKGLFR